MDKMGQFQTPTITKKKHARYAWYLRCILYLHPTPPTHPLFAPNIIVLVSLHHMSIFVFRYLFRYWAEDSEATKHQISHGMCLWRASLICLCFQCGRMTKIADIYLRHPCRFINLGSDNNMVLVIHHFHVTIDWVILDPCTVLLVCRKICTWVDM